VVGSSDINNNCSTAAETIIFSQLSYHTTRHQRATTATSFRAAENCPANAITQRTHLHHAGAITQGKEGEARVGAAERDPATEPHPSPGVIGAELPAQRVPLRPL
jgi:hypothetical protein